jgi:hypothetical protein
VNALCAAGNRGYSASDIDKFGVHLIATDNLQPQHVEVSGDWKPATQSSG